MWDNNPQDIGFESLDADDPMDVEVEEVPIPLPRGSWLNLSLYIKDKNGVFHTFNPCLFIENPANHVKSNEDMQKIVKNQVIPYQKMYDEFEVMEDLLLELRTLGDVPDALLNKFYTSSTPEQLLYFLEIIKFAREAKTALECNLFLASVVYPGKTYARRGGGSGVKRDSDTCIETSWTPVEQPPKFDSGNELDETPRWSEPEQPPEGFIPQPDLVYFDPHELYNF
jgi:hypothetical protein